MTVRTEQSFRKTVTEALFLFLLMIGTLQASGQSELPDSMISERLETIRNMLEQGKANANRWWYGWLVGYSAATLIQTTVLFTSDDLNTRQDMALGAATTFLGAAGQVISPMVPGYAPDRMKQFPDRTPQERMNKLIEAERLLQESALREKNGRSWKTHAVCGAVNLSSGLITWIGFDRNVWAGLGNFILNTAITEVQIFTQPARAMKDYDNYRRKYNNSQDPCCNRSEPNWSVGVYAGRVAFRVVF